MARQPAKHKSSPISLLTAGCLMLVKAWDKGVVSKEERKDGFLVEALG